MYLVIVDTTQIQPYIFGSNRLRENIGASHLVAQATETWALATVEAVAKPNNINTNGALDSSKHIEDSGTNLAAEVLYAGGGNFVVLFRNEVDAQAFTRQLSRKALTDAPNLQLVIAQRPVDWSQSLFEQVEGSLKKLADEKRSRRLSAPLLGLGVTVMCRSTGLPAVEVTPPVGGDPGYPASTEIHAKIVVATKKGSQPSEADARLHSSIPPPNDSLYPSDFDKLGRTEREHSYIAVVHADGDEMGKRIQQIGDRYKKPVQNRDYIAALRRFSDSVEQAAQSALMDTLAQLVRQVDTNGCIVHRNSTGRELARIELRREDGHWRLPFRPIVFGGDDVTFVCDGRLGVSLAVEYLRQFENETAKRADCNGRITACAGIAIVKTHYPFARAYALADELCKSAKNYRRKQVLTGSCLDWHFAPSGLAGDIEEIRRREYTTKEGSLTLRPLTLNGNNKERQRAWNVVRQGITEFQGEDWAKRRNKVKALRDTLREGREAVKLFRTRFMDGGNLPDVEPSMANWPTEGWHGPYCGYFDAIELADYLIPLEGKQTP